MIDTENSFDKVSVDEADNPAIHDGLADYDAGGQDGGRAGGADDTVNDDADGGIKASEKEILESRKNRAQFLSRQTILLAVGGGTVLLMLVSLVIIPSFRTEKKREQTRKLGTSSAVPQEIASWHPVSNPYDPFSRAAENEPADVNGEVDVLAEIKAVTGGVAEKSEDTKFTDAAAQPRPAASAAYHAPTRQETNRNEQQKAVQRMRVTDGFAGQVPGGASAVSVAADTYGGSGLADVYGASQDFMGSMSGMMGDIMGTNSYERQNGQQGKQEFMSGGAGSVGFRWNGEYSLDYGTIITATLVTGINTDLPGMIVARVASNVFSSGGRHILIPAGTRVFATYNSSVTYGQSRIQIAWNKMIRPDGLEIDLGNFPGVDPQGFSGSDARTKLHALEYMKAFGLIGAFSIIDAEVEAATGKLKDNLLQQLTGNMYSEASKIGQKAIDRALDIQPTLTIPQGSRVSIITNVSMSLPPFEQELPEKRYVRRN